MSATEGPVLIAYDGSPAAREAIVAAAGLVASNDALVITVWEEGLAVVIAEQSLDGTTMPPMMDPELVREVDRAEHDRADQLAHEGAELARSLGINAQPLAMPDEGNVARTILGLAQERKAAAIVVGSRGHSGLRKTLEGSTSKGILKHAPCPVIVVPEHHQSRD